MAKDPRLTKIHSDLSFWLDTSYIKYPALPDRQQLFIEHVDAIEDLIDSHCRLGGFIKHCEDILNHPRRGPYWYALNSTEGKYILHCAKMLLKEGEQLEND